MKTKYRPSKYSEEFIQQMATFWSENTTKITLTDAETKLLIDLVKDERKYATSLRMGSEHVLEQVGCGNICAKVQKKQIKEAEETIDRCNELLKKLGVEE